MSQSLARIWLHIVFSTKERWTYLQNAELREEMFRMLSHHAGQSACPTACVGGWIDHVHVLCGLSRTITVAELVEVMKRETSKWAKHKTPDLNAFHWQNGYSVFSVSQSNVESVVNYIKHQAEHHGKMSFQDELRLICKKHNVEIDERYVWE
jgi:putative transposase